jgi:tetratricopeptide (TPR) repeat protein
LPAPIPDRNRPTTLRTVALVAGVVRVAYLAQHARSDLFSITVLDARYFERLAQALAAGAVPDGLATGFRPLLYPVLLAPLYALFGSGGAIAAQLLQHAAGVLTAVAVAALARRLFSDERAALAAGVLYALAPVPLFFEGELLVEASFTALSAGVLLLLASDRGTPRGRGSAIGSLLALAAQLRPNALLLLAAAPLRAARHPSSRRRLTALVLAATTVLLLISLFQWPLTGRFRLLPEAGGVNLYLGNERQADGLVPRQDFAVTHGDEYLDSVELFAEAALRRDLAARGEPTDRRLAPGELTRYWIARTAEEVAADPIGRVVLLARKSLVLIWNGEVPNNRSFDFVADEESSILRLLPARFGLLFALALVGLDSLRRSAARFWTLSFAVTHGAGVVLFFVADRYRLPLYLPAAALAGGGLVQLVVAVRSRSTPRVARRAALLALGATLSFPDWTGARADLPGVGRDLYFRSIARLELNDAEGALVDAQRAAMLEPDDPHAPTQSAVAALALGDLARAGEWLARAESLAPGEPRVQNALGVLAERRGDPVEALVRYDRALRAAGGFVPATVNSAWLLLRLGSVEEAAVRLRSLPDRTPPTVQLLVMRSELARRAGNPDEARRLSAEAHRISAAIAARLEAELSAPSTSRP